MSARTPTQTDRIIGQRVRLARKRKKFSQTMLGSAVGVTYQQIQKYENGTDRIGAARLFEVACATEQPITFFFDETAEQADSIDVVEVQHADSRVEKLLVAVSKMENKRLLDDLVRLAETFAAARRNE